jgi:hypothetical protein
VAITIVSLSAGQRVQITGRRVSVLEYDWGYRLDMARKACRSR